MEVIRLKKEEFTLWNQYVENHPDGTIFHKTIWLQNINSDVEVYVVLENNVIKAGVSLIKSKRYGVTGYHFPEYTPYFGPLIDPELTQRISDYHNVLTALLDALPPSKVYDFVLTPGNHNIHPFHWKGYEISIKIATKINTVDIKHYTSLVHKSKSRYIKKIEEMYNNEDIVLHHNIDPAVLLNLHKQTQKRKKFKDSDELYLKIFSSDFVNKHSYMGTIAASYNKQIIACIVYLYDNNYCYNILNSSIRLTDPTLNKINFWLLDFLIKEKMKVGIRFDFEGSMLKGVEEMYRFMGGTQIPVYRCIKSSSIRYNIVRFIRNYLRGRK